LPGLTASIATALLALGLGPFSWAQDKADVNAEQGFSLELADSHWEMKESAPAKGGGMRYDYRDARNKNRSLALILWRTGGGHKLSDLLDSELRQMSARGKVSLIAKTTQVIADLEGAAVRYGFDRDKDKASLVIEATYFETGRLLGRLSVTLPAEERDDLDEQVKAARKALLLEGPLVAPPKREEPPAPRPIRNEDPDPDHVVTVIHGLGPDVAYRYLEALPGAARANRGSPALLVVGARLSDPARHYLEKYRPGTIRLTGPPHPELPLARKAEEDWPTGGTIVACEKRLGPAVQAACLAMRLDVPLLVVGMDFERRLRAAHPDSVLTLGSVHVPAGFPVQSIDGPEQVAAAAGGAEYIALCNVHESQDANLAVLASGLAAIRDGIVLPVDVRVDLRSVGLEITEEKPPGLDESGSGKYLAARFNDGDRQVLVAARATAEICVGSSFAPRYGRLRIDLDGDGKLESDEEPRIGSMIDLGGSACHLTYHYAHPFVPYLRSELLLGEADPAEIRSRIIDVTRVVDGITHLAIVGTPKGIPFFYRECEGYFETYDIKQELPSDAPYANLDEDSYLELAVGRIPVEDLETGSAIMATIATYSDLSRSDLSRETSHRATAIQPGFAAMEGSLPWVLPNAEALIRGIEGDLAAAGIEVDGYYRDQVDIDVVIASMRRSAWIAYFNHSGPNSWGIHPGSSIVTARPHRPQDRSLPILDGTPIVFGGGCSSAALDVGIASRSTFVGRFLELGAVAYLGNTRVASAHSEYLVKLFFARLASGDATIGQAYRDGRNFLAHLLEQGHLVSNLDLAVEEGFQDFLWGQYYIMNFFGDPALVPSLPPSNEPDPIEVTIRKTSRPDRLRLIVTNRGKNRCDPIQIMAASGQGTPREIFARTGPGMTSSEVPRSYVRDGLSPVRTRPEIQPGAWVDVELPAGAHHVEVTLVSGPDWSDRGFAVFPGSAGEPRMQMYVPLVRANLEDGRGKVARRVEFDVRFRIKSGDADPGETTQHVPRIHVEEPWSARRSPETRISTDARKILHRIKSRHGPIQAAGLDFLEWTMNNPQPRFYGQTRFHGRWDHGTTTIEARNLPPVLQARREQIEEALAETVDIALGNPLPSTRGMRIEVRGQEGDNDLLVLTPINRGEGEERTEVYVSSRGLVQRIVKHQFGLIRETGFEWLEEGDNRLLERRVDFDPRSPGMKNAYEIGYSRRHGYLLPEKITLRLIGRFPYALHFEFDYLKPAE
jgi:hypothetical protein